MKIMIKDISIHIPDGLNKLNSMPNDPIDSVVYGNRFPTMQSSVFIYPIPKESAVFFGRPEVIINSLHNNLADNEGIIEVVNGKTKGGMDYIYSITKSLKKPHGVLYTLREHIDFITAPVEILAFFDETGTTGKREAMVLTFARHEKIVDEKLNGWMFDPYSPDYKKGVLMNLSELTDFDKHFPGHPLTELRIFIDYIINYN